MKDQLKILKDNAKHKSKCNTKIVLVLKLAIISVSYSWSCTMCKTRSTSARPSSGLPDQDWFCANKEDCEIWKWSFHDNVESIWKIILVISKRQNHNLAVFDLILHNGSESCNHISLNVYFNLRIKNLIYFHVVLNFCSLFLNRKTS